MKERYQVLFLGGEGTRQTMIILDAEPGMPLLGVINPSREEADRVHQLVALANQGAALEAGLKEAHRKADEHKETWRERPPLL